MHLAIGAHDLYPDPGSGGTGRYVYETARRLCQRGHRVSVVTRRRGETPAHEFVDGIEVFRYDLEVAGRTATDVAAQLPRAVRSVRRATNAVDADVVSFQGPITGVLLDRLVDDRVPRSCTFHSPWSTEYLLRTRDGSLSPWRRQLNASLRRHLERTALGHADDVLTLSRFMSDQLCAVNGPVVDPEIVPGGVDVERYAPDLPASDDVDADGTAFLTVRRLSPRMGHELLLDAFAKRATAHPDDHLYIAGDGPRRGSLERRAARLDVDEQVTFLGYVPDADLPSVYASADLFVLPTTRLEGFGLATLEALASGTPAVATPVGGTVEVLSDLEREEAIPERMLTRAADADALASALERWAALPVDALERAGRACRTYAEQRYTWERTVDDLESHYEALADPDLL
jgi:glycosyltransferase involved in cell wall biosynthesis